MKFIYIKLYVFSLRKQENIDLEEMHKCDKITHSDSLSKIKPQSAPSATVTSLQLSFNINLMQQGNKNIGGIILRGLRRPNGPSAIVTYSQLRSSINTMQEGNNKIRHILSGVTSKSLSLVPVTSSQFNFKNDATKENYSRMQKILKVFCASSNILPINRIAALPPQIIEQPMTTI